MTVTDILEESLSALAAKLGEVPEQHLPEIQNIREAITAFQQDDNVEAGCFARRMKELAEAVIETRQRATIPVLKTLPVPPYDLWLPFKAANLRGSLDNIGITGANRVVNSVLGALALDPRDPKLSRLIAEHEKNDCKSQKGPA